MLSDHRPRVKICGLTSVEDAKFVVAAGADAIGLVFYAKSPRAVDMKVAVDITRAVGPFVTVVGLFVDAAEQTIHDTLSAVPLHVIQFHGDESNAFCRQFAKPFIKAIRMAPDVIVFDTIAQFPDASSLLLDAYQPGLPGGTGQSFEWQRFPANAEVPLILAGGLTPENVAQAVAQTRPYAVDVSGGVELNPGKKCPNKVAQFIHNSGRNS